MSLSLLLETDIRDKVLKRAFCTAAKVVAEQYFKDDGYLCMLWRVQLSRIFLAPPCRARLVRYAPLPHKIKLGAKRHWLIAADTVCPGARVWLRHATGRDRQLWRGEGHRAGGSVADVSSTTLTVSLTPSTIARCCPPSRKDLYSVKTYTKGVEAIAALE
jgi:hypothetical protein